MLELIALIILVISVGGIVLILTKKIPVLVQMPTIPEGIQKENIFNAFKNKIKSIFPDKIIILKILSKIRIFVLKIEKYVDSCLQRIRENFYCHKSEDNKKDNNKEKPQNS